MHVAELRLENWRCFAGDFVLPLEARAYSIVARQCDDPDRSNFCGKTSVVEAIVFALYGRHGSALEDGWISRGAQGGGVTVVLDDGTKIERHRARGGSTKLLVTIADGAVVAGKEAQAKIGVAIGLTERDSEATWLVEQKRMSLLATSRSSDLLATFDEWFELEAFDRCREEVSSAAASLSGEEAALAAERSSWQRVRDDSSGGADLASEAGEAARTVTALRADVERLVARRAEASEASDARRGALRFDELVEEGKEIAAKLKSLGEESLLAAAAEAAEESLTTIDRSLGEASADATRRRFVAEGRFDGRCPIADVACPARDAINRGRDAARDAFERADAARSDAEALRRSKSAARAEAVGALERWRRSRSKLDGIRAECERLIPAWKAARLLADAPDAAVVDREIADAHARLIDAERTSADLSARVERAAKAVATIAGIDERLAVVRAALTTRREADAVFDRARRVAAEDAVREVEDGANELLRGCSIPLSVSVRWGRDGVGLASACGSCGRPFGRSAREKLCAGCGAKRGPNLVDRVDVALSDRSGATEDLAGWALRLSAFRCLRRARSSSWDVVVLDEPLSALDRALRRSFSQHLAGMLSATARQAFVISHTDEVVNMLSGRILVTSDGTSSKVEVVA